MKKIGILFLLAGWLCCLPACDDKKDREGPAAAPPGARQVMTLDKQSRPGRTFMYLDEGGQVVKTRRYEDIPEKYRAAVMVVEGHKRGKVTRSAAGEIEIQALPPRITAEEKSGAEDAKALLARHPPDEGPPSTEAWSDDRWREELKRELEELKREEQKALQEP